ncbi:PFTB repeat [Trinorchestia longiramus]|nr:PFTB repeat [Trinorchestia longiramus]
MSASNVCSIDRELVMEITNHSLWCCRDNFQGDKTQHHGEPTVTSKEQIKVEESISACYQYIINKKTLQPEDIKLQRNRHISFLRNGLKNLSRGFECLDASRPWLVYWCIHALHLLEETLSEDEQDAIVDFLDRCQCSDGGFAGGPGQLPHLAPTYAAVNALVTIGSPAALATINRQALSDFLARMVTPEGSFRMHEGGEVDIRGTYCAVSVARLCRLAVHPLMSRTASWIVQCQTYEGGFSGSPGLEAHGGYTFCGLAALALLNCQHLADNTRLLRWATSRQMRLSGGFQGRTNKLVDGCYSFWQGALFPLLHHTLTTEGSCGELEEPCWLFQCEALQNYLLLCCQHPSGGLIDKPGKSPDFYHTCYTLSGLSVAQHFCYGNTSRCTVVGDASNEVALTHPLYNVGMSAVLSANQFFKRQPDVQPSVFTRPVESQQCPPANGLGPHRSPRRDDIHSNSSAQYHKSGFPPQNTSSPSASCQGSDGCHNDNGHPESLSKNSNDFSAECLSGSGIEDTVQHRLRITGAKEYNDVKITGPPKFD